MMVIIGRCYGVRDDIFKGYKLEGILVILDVV
jgi:hypothetical protein